MEVYEFLINTHPDPKVTYCFQELHECIPLAHFLDLNRPNFNSDDFNLFRIDAGDGVNGTAIVYERVLVTNNHLQPELGLVSDYDLSRIIPPFLMKSSPLFYRINEKEVEAELQKIHGKYKQLLYK